MDKKILFVDAETDGLYGHFLSVAGILCDSFGNETDSFYHRVDIKKNGVTDPWVLENVIPVLSGGVIEDTPEDLLESFWQWYRACGEADVIADVTFPVECRLFSECVLKDPDTRKFQGPYPLLDLSSMLYAKGMDPNADRRSLIDATNYQVHNALDDVRMSRDIWLKYIRNRRSL